MKAYENLYICIPDTINCNTTYRILLTSPRFELSRIVKLILFSDIPTFYITHILSGHWAVASLKTAVWDLKWLIKRLSQFINRNFMRSCLDGIEIKYTVNSLFNPCIFYLLNLLYYPTHYCLISKYLFIFMKINLWLSLGCSGNYHENFRLTFPVCKNNNLTNLSRFSAYMG